MALNLERKFGYVIALYGLCLTLFLIYKNAKDYSVVKSGKAIRLSYLKNQDKKSIEEIIFNRKFVLSQENERKRLKQQQEAYYDDDEDDDDDDVEYKVKKEEPENVIPSHMFQAIDNIVRFDDFKLPDCADTPKRTNFVYVKVHKCASDTIAAVGRRFAMERNLTVVLPVKMRFLLGWPHQLQPYMYRPLKKNTFNIIVDHMVYNRTYLDTIMPKNTIYFTSLRELMSRLISAVDYFGIAECSFIPGNLTNARNKTDAFLSDMEKYDSRYKSVENIFQKSKCGCVPKGFSVIKNAMAFDLGFPTGFHMYDLDESKNYKFIIEWLKKIHKEMKIVIMTDKFDESMVLLKKYMCWNTKDILYRRLNNWRHPPPNFTKQKVEAFRNWSNIDTLLYELFSKVHAARVRNLGEDFQNETEEFQRHLARVQQFCLRVAIRWNKYKKVVSRVLYMDATKWDNAYRITAHDCFMMFDKKHLRNKIKEDYDNTTTDSYINLVKNVPPNPGYKWC